MRIGLDYHGVADKNLKFFCTFANLFMNAGHEIHLLTGLTKEDYGKLLSSERVSHSHFFSVTDYLLEGDIPHMKDRHGRPMFDNTTWYKTKAEYCDLHMIDLMIDDSVRYQEYFTTPFILWRKKGVEYH